MEWNLLIIRRMPGRFPCTSIYASADISHLELWEQATIVCLENLVGSPAINQNEPEVEIREHSKTTFRSLLLTLHSSGDLGGRGKGVFLRLFLDIVFPLYILHHFGLNQTIDACSNVAGPWI